MKKTQSEQLLLSNSDCVFFIIFSQASAMLPVGYEATWRMEQISVAHARCGM